MNNEDLPIDNGTINDGGIKASIRKSIKETEFGDNKDNDNETTKFKETGKLWCNTIQNYLENEFGFKGITKLKIFGHAGYLEIFNISISGKGTNDFLVETMGFISDMVSTSKIHYYSDYNKIYNIINSYFKS